MGAGLLVARLGLAFVFVVAAAGKFGQRAGTRLTLSQFGVPARLTSASAILLPVVEAGAAILLVVDSTARWGGLIATLLLAVFVAAIARSLARGDRPDCNCFGAAHSAPIGRGTLVRNLVLGGIAAAVAVGGPGTAIKPTLDGVDRTTLIVVGGALLALAVVANAWFSWQLLQQNGRLISRVRALEDAAEIAGPPAAEREGLPEGEPAPQFELPTLAGGRVSLHDLLAPERPVGLIFSDSGCPGCASLVQRLPAIQEELAGTLGVAVIMRSDGAHPAVPTDAPDLSILLQRQWEIAAQYRVTAVPSAVIIGEDGRIASPLVTGENAVERLLLSAGSSQSVLPLLEVLGIGR